MGLQECSNKLGTTGWLIICVFIGIILGICVNAAEPSDDVVYWVGFLGQIFLRALQCLVIPMIACNMIVGICEITGLGQTGMIGSRTFAVYMLTTFVAAVEGLILTLMFRGLFIVSETEPYTTAGHLGMKCPNGAYMSQLADGTLACSATTLGMNETFPVTVTGDLFVLNGNLLDQGRGMTQTIAQIFIGLVPNNIFRAAWQPEILGVITFAVAFGYYMGTIELEDGEENVVLKFFAQLNEVIQAMIKAIVGFAPVAVLFMIAGALAAAKDFISLVQNIGILILIVELGHLFHVLVFLPSLFYFLVRENPFVYLSKILPAITFAFGCASSAATLPVTMKCVEATKEVPTAVARFVLSLGATINMDGSGIYFPACIVFLADVSGQGDLIGVGELIVLILVSTLGAVGSSPIPNSGLVMIVTIWNAVFPGVTVPAQVAYVQAIDWLLDRSVTSVNVSGDAMVARIIAQLIGSNKDAEFELSKEELDAHTSTIRRFTNVEQRKSIYKEEQAPISLGPGKARRRSSAFGVDEKAHVAKSSEVQDGEFVEMKIAAEKDQSKVSTEEGDEAA